MSTTAIIPARSGSTGIPHKNLQLFRGVPLFIHAANLAAQARHVDDVVISVDSADYEAIAKAHGHKTNRRPGHLASDTATVDDLAVHYVNLLPEYDQFATHLLVLQPTVPLITAGVLDDMIETSMRNGKSLTAATPYRHALWDYPNMQRWTAGNRQSGRWAKYLSEVGVRVYPLYVGGRRSLGKRKDPDGTPENFYILPENQAIDIDTWAQLEEVRQLDDARCVVIAYETGEVGTGHQVRARTVHDFLVPHFPAEQVHYDYNQQHACRGGVVVYDGYGQPPHYNDSGWLYVDTVDQFGFREPDKAIIRPEIRALPKHGFLKGGGGKTLFVSFGYDIANHFDEAEPVLKYLAATQGWEVTFADPPNQFLRLLSEASVVLTNAGNLMLETNYLQIPTIVVPENDREWSQHPDWYARHVLRDPTHLNLAMLEERIDWTPPKQVLGSGLEAVLWLVNTLLKVDQGAAR